jgi:hypothetical protein
MKPYMRQVSDTQCVFNNYSPVTNVGADLGVFLCGRNDQINCVHAGAGPFLELGVGWVVRGGDVCELRHAALVQYHNYLIPAQQMQTIDIQAGYGLGGSALFRRNASRR